MGVRLVLWAIAGLLSAGPAIAQEEFGNQSVIALTRAGVGTEVVIAKIAGLPCAYDVSTNSILALKGAGVADAVVAAMIDRCSGASKALGAVGADADPAISRAPGLYIELGSGAAHQLVKVRPTNASGGRVSGNGSLLFPARVKLGIPRVSAQTAAASRQPRFYFYFRPDDANVGDFGAVGTFAAQSPSEFNLVKFKLHDGQREMVIGKQKVFGARIGIDPKDAIQFATREMGDGIFEVTPSALLEPGEYGFVLRSGNDAYRIYDFQVPG